MNAGSPGKESKGKETTSKLLRERLGGVPEKNLEYSKEVSRVRRAVLEALKEGPGTVPEIAGKTGLPADKVFWHLMSLRKYGKVCEIEDVDEYVRYGLLEEGGER